MSPPTKTNPTLLLWD